MMQNKKTYEISWAQFEACNSNTQEAFENMCRWLFNDFFFDGKAILHSNPNNPGIEVVPRLEEKSNKRISFQAKYFSSIDYSQIMHSAEMAVKYYADQLDIIYLYCNKDVTTSSLSYQNIEQFLLTSGIELVPITNQAILEQVMKNETISWHYFDHIALQQSWFREQVQTSLASLGPRYNDEFNVPTRAEKVLNAFLRNGEAAEAINKRKNDVIDKIRSQGWRYRKYGHAAKKILNTISEIEDISADTILDCLSWKDHIRSLCFHEFEELHLAAEGKREEYSKAIEDRNHRKVNELLEQINDIEQLLELPESVAPEEKVCSALEKQIFVVKGEAGVGKSQLFAFSAEKEISADHAAILLLGTSFQSDSVLLSQIADVIGVNLEMEALLHKLEGIAIQQNCCVCIFIDAINESTYKNVWKNGLPLLLNMIRKYPHIRLAISVRSGYEKIVFNEAILKQINEGEIGLVKHQGFREESIRATRTFLNHYGISFVPSFFLQSEMTNPLFLTLFCKNYSGENYDMFTLFERLIERANEEAQMAAGLDESLCILQYLVDEIVDVCLEKETQIITQEELFDMKFWERYGLSFKKIPYVTSLVRSGFMISMASEMEESYSFGYNLLQDFVCAKKVIKKYPRKSELISYIQADLLKIREGSITNYHNIDVFIVVCGLYAERYHEECFFDIEKLVVDEWDKDSIIRRYVNSFLWRKASSVNADDFLEFVNSYTIERDLVFRVLVENSTKEQHPLNALFLHQRLHCKSITDRDELWTTYVNNLANDDERLFQLILFFDEGNVLDGLSESNTKLLLILFSWLLTSSNRFLRDKASKAMVELFKLNFQLCLPLLRMFENVNDPYVIQRLYGCIFGACTKRTEEKKDEFKKLVTYVFNQIFNKQEVYPDILLRDYARLIIERWRHEYPEETDFIDISKTVPPYRSTPIPVLEPQEYSDSGIRSGWNSIKRSLKINHSGCPGMYGDFGRYTFQAALERFENIDIVNLYHYAMQFIHDELGYTDELLGVYDCTPRYYGYNRHNTKKIERIGKKYQWIAFYNILARVSDSHRIKEWERTPYLYEGPWEPYVRDFDPTLNRNTWTTMGVPKIHYPETKDEFLELQPIPNSSDIHNWKNAKPEFFTSLPEKMIVNDEDNIDWVTLYLSEDKKNKKDIWDDTSMGFSKDSQQMWLISHAFFVKSEQFAGFVENILSVKENDYSVFEGRCVYSLFNREYAWSPGYQDVFKEAWNKCEIYTGKYRIEKETFSVPDFENIKYDEDGEASIPFVEKEFEKRIPEDVLTIDVMPAFSQVLWEEEYDASQEETTGFHIPCGDIINHFKLKQDNVDGYYYSQEDVLVCFDGEIAGLLNGLFIRKDFLDRYLQERNVKLCWKCVGEKQYFLGDMNQEWSRWNGIHYYEDGKVKGEFQISED